MTQARAVTSLLEWFIPAELRANADTYRRAQMFVGAHVFGPPLGHLIAIYLFFIDPAPGWHLWILVIALAAYYLFPFLLRWTGRFTLLSLLSMQNLAFIVLSTSFNYGGVSSPFLIWGPVVPMLAFYYLGAAPGCASSSCRSWRSTSRSSTPSICSAIRFRPTCRSRG